MMDNLLEMVVAQIQMNVTQTYKCTKIYIEMCTF